MGRLWLASFCLLGLGGWLIGGSALYFVAGLGIGAGGFFWHRSRAKRSAIPESGELTQVVDGVPAIELAKIASTFKRLCAVPVFAPPASRGLDQLQSVTQTMTQLIAALAGCVDSSDRAHWRVRAGFEEQYVLVVRALQSAAGEISPFEGVDLDEQRAAHRLAAQRLRRGKISQAQADAAAKRWALWEGALARANQKLDESENAMGQLLDAHAKLRTLVSAQAPVAEVIALVGIEATSASPAAGARGAAGNRAEQPQD